MIPLLNAQVPLYPIHDSTTSSPNSKESIIFSVVTQYYEAEVVSEYVIRGNTAVLKCNIPSFVADFVKVEAWVGSDSSEYLPTDDIGNCSRNRNI